MLISRHSPRILKQIARSTLTKRVAPKSTLAVDHFSSSGDRDRGMSKENKEKPMYSNTISWGSPESDFCTSHVLIKSQFTDLDDNQYRVDSDDIKEWSGSLSFSSPESDFTSSIDDSLFASSINTSSKVDILDTKDTNKAKDTFFQHLKNNSLEQSNLAYSLSFTSAEADFCNPVLTDMLNDHQKKLLRNPSQLATLSSHGDANQLSAMNKRDEVDVSMKAIKPKVEQGNNEMYNLEYEELRAHADLLGHEDALPINMEEATEDNDDRAIVITEAQVPFRIVNVNTAWENLCGYTKEECSGKTLKCIQGEDTNHAAITALMSQLLRGEEAGTLLINYRKDGSKFLNRLRVGALRDERNIVSHFVGVLKEVKELEDSFSHQGSKILA